MADKPVDQMNLEEYLAFEDSLRVYDGKDKIISSLEIAEEMLKRNIPPFKIMTHLPSVDRILDGVEECELVVVTGPTGQGKTSTLLHVTRELARVNTKCLWFSYEMSYAQLINKMAEQKNIYEFYVPKEIINNHIDFIERKIMEGRAKYDIRTIFIDHLSMLYSLDKFSRGNASLELGDIVAKIKNMALRHGVIIFLVAHAKKVEAGQEIFLEDIRDSGHIANLADTVITVQRVPNDYKEGDRRIGQLGEHDNRIRIKVEKNRRKGTRGALLAKYENGLISEVPPEEYRQEEIATNKFNRF